MRARDKVENKNEIVRAFEVNFGHSLQMPRVVSSKRKSSILPGFDRPAEKRAHHISVYNEFPDYEITLNDFEDLGKNRFLRKICFCPPKWVPFEIIFLLLSFEMDRK